METLFSQRLQNLQGQIIFWHLQSQSHPHLSLAWSFFTLWLCTGSDASELLKPLSIKGDFLRAPATLGLQLMDPLVQAILYVLELRY